MICNSYARDFMYAQILTHSYTLNVMYLHDNAQKTLYKALPYFLKLNLAITHTFTPPIPRCTHTNTCHPL